MTGRRGPAGGPRGGGSGGGRAPLLALVGPTAAGKTEASILVAERLGAEIVNVDSTLVFRGMDVWTGKPTPEQLRRLRAVEVAEVIGTPEAGKVLAYWAGGAPGAQFTVEAAAAVRRLGGVGR